MPWLTLDFHPGFAEDLTSWHTEIERDGRLLQTVSICRFLPREERIVQHQTKLAPEQIAELERLVIATNFSAVAAGSKHATIDDAETIRINVAGEDTLCAPLLTWNFIARREPPFACPDLVGALRLWHAIDGLSPHKHSA